MWIPDRERIRYAYTPAEGNFGYVNQHGPAQPDANGVTNVALWESCRERFLNVQPGLRTFYFAHDLPQGRGRSIAVFIEKLEKKLGIKSIRRTKVQATNKRRVVKIHIAPFWDQSDIRRSLFSAILRASVNYRIYRDNFEEALYSVSYTSETRRAVERFINRRATHYWGDNEHGGWVTVFGSATPTQISRMLRQRRKLKHPRARVIRVEVPVTASQAA